MSTQSVLVHQPVSIPHNDEMTAILSALTALKRGDA